MQFQASDPNSFYDCFAFWTPKRGIVQGDGVNGKFPDLRTTDGVTWEDISNNLPPAFANEGRSPRVALASQLRVRERLDCDLRCADPGHERRGETWTPITLRLLVALAPQVHSQWLSAILGMASLAAAISWEPSSGDGNIWRWR